MTSIFAHPVVRSRLIEFLGGDSLERTTAAYISPADGGLFDRRQLRPPAQLDQFLSGEFDLARSLADSRSLLLHLDLEYVNFDSPAEAYLNPSRSFDLQEPVVHAIEALLLQWGISPLHLITGRGHHFIWRITRASRLAERLIALSPAPELLDACERRTPPGFGVTMNRRAHRAFASLSLLMEFVAHRVKATAAPLAGLPVEITAVEVGPGITNRREIISVDISEYGDPLHTRMVRMPFTHYLKPWFNGLARSPDLEGRLAPFRTIPLHEMDIRQALSLRHDDPAVIELAGRACVRIPEQAEGTTRLWAEYLASPLRRFHQAFYSVRHEAEARWPETYDRTPVHALPPCAQHILTWPNDLLLRPAGLQLITRCLLSEGWHPRHIAGLIRSKFENPRFHWREHWDDYAPALRADFYTRVFAGLLATGLDPLIDLNCTSNREKNFCFRPADRSCSLAPVRDALLSPTLP